MRPIKFRHPIVFNGKFHSWHYFGYIDNGFSGPQSVIEPRYQFTGLLDKNGKEIYEGDILQFEYDNNFKFPKIMDFENGRFALRDTFGNFRFGTGTHKYSVVGNIYENPELLKVKP